MSIDTLPERGTVPPLRSQTTQDDFNAVMESWLTWFDTLTAQMNDNTIPGFNTIIEDVSTNLYPHMETILQAGPNADAAAASAAAAAGSEAAAEASETHTAEMEAHVESMYGGLTEGATWEPVPNTPRARDGSGRAQVEAPVADKDIVNKAWAESNLGTWPEHTWEEVPALPCMRMGVDRTGRYLLCSDNDHTNTLFASDDFGESKRTLTLPTAGPHALLRTNGVFMMTTGTAAKAPIYISRDAGDSWNALSTVNANGAQKIDICGNNGIYIYSNDGVSASQVRTTIDGGDTWIDETPRSSIQYVVKHVYCTTTHFFAVVHLDSSVVYVLSRALDDSSWIIASPLITSSIAGFAFSELFCFGAGQCNYLDDTSTTKRFYNGAASADGGITWAGCGGLTVGLGVNPYPEYMSAYGQCGMCYSGQTTAKGSAYLFSNDGGASFRAYATPSFQTPSNFVITESGIYWSGHATGSVPRLLVCRNYK